MIANISVLLNVTLKRPSVEPIECGAFHFIIRLSHCLFVIDIGDMGQRMSVVS